MKVFIVLYYMIFLGSNLSLGEENVDKTPDNGLLEPSHEVIPKKGVKRQVLSYSPQPFEVQLPPTSPGIFQPSLSPGLPRPSIVIPATVSPPIISAPVQTSISFEPNPVVIRQEIPKYITRTVTKEVPIDRLVPVPVIHKVPVTVHKHVPVYYEKKVPYPVKVPVSVPVPYPVTVERHVPVDRPVYVDRQVNVPYPVDRLVPVPQPVYVDRPVAVPQPQPQPQPLVIERQIPSSIPSFNSFPLPELSLPNVQEFLQL